MRETKNIEKQFKDFEKKFGFKTYENIKQIYSSLYQKIEELKKSRDKWKEKYNSLKNGSNNSKTQ